MILETLAYIGTWSCQRAFLFKHTTLLDFPYWDMLIFLRRPNTPFMLPQDDLGSKDSFWSNDVWLVVLLSSMLDLEMLTLGHSTLISGSLWDNSVHQTYFLEVILHEVCSFCIFHIGSCFSHRWLILEVFVLVEAYPFWEDIFILRHSHLIDFDNENWPSVYDCYFWWIIKLMTHCVQFSQHT